jgi:hypothetical protein
MQCHIIINSIMTCVYMLHNHFYYVNYMSRQRYIIKNASLASHPKKKKKWGTSDSAWLLLCYQEVVIVRAPLCCGRMRPHPPSHLFFFRIKYLFGSFALHLYQTATWVLKSTISGFLYFSCLSFYTSHLYFVNKFNKFYKRLIKHRHIFLSLPC